MNKRIIYVLGLLLLTTCKKDVFEEDILVPVVFFNIEASASDGGSVDNTGGSFESGTTLIITATPDSEYLFAGWTGSDSTNNPLTIIINSNQEISAIFKKKKYQLSINISGDGTVAEEVINSEKTSDYDSGSKVRLIAQPANEWSFLKWSGDHEGIKNPIEINITESKNIIATFEKLDPIFLDENGITIKASEYVRVGDVYNLNAIEYTIVNNDLLKSMLRRGEDLSKVVTTKVTDLEGLFSLDENFNQNIGSWDTSNITSMKNLFEFSAKFNQDIGNWDTSNVTDMSRMFVKAIAFNGNIQNWNTSNVTDMSSMFFEAINFNQDIGNWDTSNVTDMSSMFYGSALFNQYIGDWNTSNVKIMRNMFNSASDFNQNIGNWDNSSVANMANMFKNAVVFNKNIENWDTSKVVNMNSMFYGALTFNQNLGEWDTSNVMDMGSMFYNSTSFNQNIGDWDTTNVEMMDFMFKDAVVFNQNIGRWNLSRVTNINEMFRGAISFNKYIGSWNTYEVENMEGVFKNAKVFNQDISSWNTYNVFNMDKILSGASNFNKDLTNWCVKNIMTEPSSFSYSSSLTDENKPNWGTCSYKNGSTTFSIEVTSNNNSDFTLNGTDRMGYLSGADPNISLNLGDTVKFILDTSNHPFYLKYSLGNGAENAIGGFGITNNGSTYHSIKFTPGTIGEYYYQCSLHNDMNGKIIVSD